MSNKQISAPRQSPFGMTPPWQGRALRYYEGGTVTVTSEDQSLTVAQLAPLDQFHTRGILATAELGAAAGLKLAVVMGSDFPVMTSNLARNIRESRLGVLSAILTHDS